MALAREAAVHRLAREMIERHGDQAVLRAAERLNERIDQQDWGGRDMWASVIHVIHELRRAAPEPAPGSPQQPSKEDD